MEAASINREISALDKAQPAQLIEPGHEGAGWNGDEKSDAINALRCLRQEPLRHRREATQQGYEGAALHNRLPARTPVRLAEKPHRDLYSVKIYAAMPRPS